MRCHYEVLGVPRDINDDDLKKVYRKLALKWHPDKNLDNTDEAKEQFQIIQQAYEVLSDPHERAFYDKHREAIIRGGVDGDYKDNSLDVFQYYTPSCYKGYGDDDKGFYAVYREVFNKLASEDSEFMTDEDSDFEVPSFGNSKSSYDTTVHCFYSYWQSYSTKKSYAWLDPYDIRDIPNRRVVRVVVKENKKVRDKAKRERNEQIRNLVTFVRKRDKRVQAYAKVRQERAAENAKKAEERRKKQVKGRQELLKDYKECEWVSSSNIEKQLKDIEAKVAEEFGESDPFSSYEEESANEDDSGSEDDLVSNALYCAVCNKLFKTAKAFANHENSKKHKENIKIVQAQMLEEDEKYFKPHREDEAKETEENGLDGTMENANHVSVDSIDICDTGNERVETKKCKKKNKGIHLATQSDSDVEVELSLGQSKKQRKKQRQAWNKPQQEPENSEVKIVQNGEEATTENVEAATKNGKEVAKESSFESSTLITDEATKPISKKTKKEKPEGDSQNGKKTLTVNDTFEEGDKVKTKVKKVKEVKRRGRKEMEAYLEEVKDIDHCCVTCRSKFLSKNKLFEHLKKTGHSVFVPHGSTASEEVKTKQKGRSKKNQL